MSAERILSVEVGDLREGDVILDSFGHFDNYGDWVTIADIKQYPWMPTSVGPQQFRLFCNGRYLVMSKLDGHVYLNISRTFANRKGNLYYD